MNKYHRTLQGKNSRGNLDDVPFDLTEMEKLQAKVDLANDFLHSQWDGTVRLGRKIEAEVRETVRHLIAVDEYPTITAAVNAVYGTVDLLNKPQGMVKKVIVSKSFAERWSNNPDNYKAYYGTEEVEVKD